MDKIVIEGGSRLSGEVNISGSKNAALPILVSSLLADGVNTYSNVPNLRDIESIKSLMQKLGATVESDGNIVKIDASGLNNYEAPYEIVRKMRASILVLGPLIARLKKARVSLPGGCAIGARPVDLHLKGLIALGAKIELNHGYINAVAEKLVGTDIYFDIITVTGTENLMMAASLAEGETILRNCAREPEVVALADTLNKMGAEITGAGTSIIKIKGQKTLNPTSVEVISDRIEAGTFIVAGALTEGNIKIIGAEPENLGSIINKLRQTGTDIIIDGRNILVKGPKKIKSADVKTLPYPGFATDMQAQFMVLMSVADGSSVISENVFENRFIHVSELQRMGANINISGNTAIVKGVENLSGAPVMATDLRASASLIIAGLRAIGTTEVHRVYHLDRGYESIEKKFQALGANIKRTKE
ncbi:MAG: UDP-N-acetylglucosamine 1-carboxyvinyltransferase [Desulfobacterales bacterium]|nr:UDP-N-acetylglucosamine 1-carboxyvinyltransferase [Desulfobacterales bacterium]